ncbi:hypothetical protein WOLCODRAFT_139747 [Wolfiporia cocos MD-104 SS10]|uniref:Uncharacterized protein n=1 Tax=Wolfiporia cocos (strain MD-104) TaxID=742152 RepID=A0A2H3J086_WOLCO|nr:hypothetical protein WOLCODRAFT_139747 [Wolfiporia cocos MD-104 SS10]
MRACVHFWPAKDRGEPGAGNAYMGPLVAPQTRSCHRCVHAVEAERDSESPAHITRAARIGVERGRETPHRLEL